MLEPGDAAPDFTLPDQDGTPVTLSTLRGVANVPASPATTRSLAPSRDRLKVRALAALVRCRRTGSSGRASKRQCSDPFTRSLLPKRPMRAWVGASRP